MPKSVVTHDLRKTAECPQVPANWAASTKRAAVEDSLQKQCIRYNSMHGTISMLLILIIEIGCQAVNHAFHSGVMDFDQNTKAKQVQVPHINSPIILHSLTKVQTTAYFSYWSAFQNDQGVHDDNFTLFVEVGGVNSYQITVQYLFLQPLPNLEVTMINLTWSRPQKLYHSFKGISFEESTFLTAHLIGFTTSNITHNNFFYAVKGKSTYTIYTGINFTDGAWIAMNFIMLQADYDREGVACQGSYIDSYSEVSKQMSPMSVAVKDNLQLFVGLQALHSTSNDFVLDVQKQQIVMGQGLYSFSIVVLNTTCVYTSLKAGRLTGKNRVYYVVMIVFAGLCGFEILCLLAYCLYSKYYRENIRVDEDQNKQAVEIHIQMAGNVALESVPTQIRLLNQQVFPQTRY